MAMVQPRPAVDVAGQVGDGPVGAGQYEMNDSGLTLIGHYLRKLEELNVKHIRRVSQVGLNTVINGCKRLKRLYVSKKVSNPNRRNPTNGIHGLKAKGFLNIPMNLHYEEIVLPSEEVDPMDEEPSDNEEEG